MLHMNKIKELIGKPENCSEPASKQVFVNEK